MIDFLLYGTRSEEAVDGDLTFLSYAPRSFTSLDVCAGVPVGVKDDDPISPSQVDPKATHSGCQDEQIDGRVL